MPRADYILADIWNRVEGGRLQTEGVLEDALAAALEAPGVWDKLHRHLGLSADIPREPPDVSTQETVEEGRTDITLRWSNGYALNLELKAGDPPGKEQIERYLRSGIDVLAIARLPGHANVEPIKERKYLGVKTWSQFRSLEWSEAPLEWRQFVHLLDATGVVVKNVDSVELEGIVRSWDTWDKLEAWSRQGAVAVEEVLKSKSLPWASRSKKGERMSVDMSHERIVWWISHRPWQDDALAIYAGFFVGRMREGKPDPVCEGSFPDLMLSFHVDPGSPRGKRIQTDAKLQNALALWTSREAIGSRKREPRLDGSTWEVIRSRESSNILVDAPDPGTKVVDWMRDRAQEWIADGIVQRVTELAKRP